MKRLLVNTLILDDNDLECTKKEKTLDDITISKVAFNMNDLEKFDLIIYKGSLGKKILRSRV